MRLCVNIFMNASFQSVTDRSGLSQGLMLVPTGWSFIGLNPLTEYINNKEDRVCVGLQRAQKLQPFFLKGSKVIGITTVIAHHCTQSAFPLLFFGSFGSFA